MSGERRGSALALRHELARKSLHLTSAAIPLAYAAGAPRAALLALAAAKAPLVLARSWRDGDFRWIVLDSTATLAAIALVAASAWTSPAAPWLLGSILVSVVAGVVQRARLGLHRHLNHNDLYHLTQLAAVYLFYRGGLLFGG